MSRSKNLAVKYLAAAVALFGVMTFAGLVSSVYYIDPEFLFGFVPFSVAKMLHIDTMIIWLLMGFMGAVYWFLPDEFECEPAGIRAAEALFWVFVVAVQVVAALFLFVQWGPGTETTLWLVQQGRKYVEAPRWAAIGVALVMLVFAWNVVGAAFKARRITGVMAVKTGKGRSAPTVEETRKIGCVLRKGAWQRLVACAVERQRFQVGASPTRQPPERVNDFETAQC
jgi:nitric oxide reductase subunit B